MPNYAPKIQDGFREQQLSNMWMNKDATTIYHLRGVTTNATPTELFVDGISGRRIPVPQDSLVGIAAYYVGFNVTDSEGDFEGRNILVRNFGGTVAIIGASGTLFTEINDGTGTTALALAADNTNKAVSFTVTGTAAKTIYHEITLIVTVASNPESIMAYDT